MTLLHLDHISASYGPSEVLFDISFALKEGEALAVLGRNGMGKSTTIKCICGLLPYQNGNIELDGRSTRKRPAYQIARQGIGLVPEGRQVFKGLTVHENLVAAARPGYWDWQKVTKLFPRLQERQSHKAENLSGGEQQMLATARALMTNPRLLVMDEATEGLAPLIRQEIWQAIKEIKAQTGVSFIIVDKSLAELSQIADQAVILQKGEVCWQGAFSALTNDLVEEFIGI